MTLIITYEQFASKRPCAAWVFYNSPRYDKTTNSLIYPNGWNDEEAIRVAKKSMIALNWMINSELVPMTKEDLPRIKKIIATESKPETTG